MSRIITACVLFLLVIAGCVCGQLTVNHCDEKISTLIDEANKAAEEGDFDTAEATVINAESTFSECEKVLALFIDHRLVEELGAQIAKLPRLATEETSDEFLSELASANVMMIHIVRDNHPTLLNIL